MSQTRPNAVRPPGKISSRDQERPSSANSSFAVTGMPLAARICSEQAAKPGDFIAQKAQ